MWEGVWVVAGGWRLDGQWWQGGWKVEDQPRRGDAMNEEEEGEEKVALLLVITSQTFF